MSELSKFDVRYVGDDTLLYSMIVKGTAADAGVSGPSAPVLTQTIDLYKEFNRKSTLRFIDVNVPYNSEGVSALVSIYNEANTIPVRTRTIIPPQLGYKSYEVNLPIYPNMHDVLQIQYFTDGQTNFNVFYGLMFALKEFSR